MNDFAKMKTYLNSLDSKSLAAFNSKLGREISIEKNGSATETDTVQGGSRNIDPPWMETLIDEMLASREENKTHWNLLCSAANIETDDAESLRIGRENNQIAKYAGIAAICSAIAAVASAIAAIVTALKK